MAWSIDDYKPEPGNNTQINGIDISEGCPPHGINNALRQIMADLAGSSAKDPAKLRSTDAHNALATGSDGKIYIPSGAAVMQDPAELLSGDGGNLLTLGTDNKLYVDPEIGETVPWDSVTGKPESYTPVKHAATHLPGGSDPIAVPNIPSGLIMLWKGTIASIPSGWVLCNGSNGTPDLRDRFVVGAGLSYAVGSSGGAATATLQGATANPDSITASPQHTHMFSGAFSVSPDPSAGPELCALIGYTERTGSGITGLSTSPSGSGTLAHKHAFSAVAQTVPPYYALCYIMKT